MTDLNQQGLDRLYSRLRDVETDIGNISQQIAAVEARGDSADALVQQREAKQREQASILRDIEDLREAMNRMRG